MSKSKFNRPMTAAEAMAILSKDEDYQRKRAKSDQELADARAKSREEQSTLIDDLANIGIQVESVWDLVNTTEAYPKAIPVLLEHLQKDYSEGIKEGLARSLVVPEAIDGWDIILAEFEKHPDKRAQGAKFGMSLALSRIIRATKRYDEALRLAREERHGENRSEFIEALGYSKDPEIIAKLEEFVDDPIVGNEARWYLKNPGRRFRGTGGTIKSDG